MRVSITNRLFVLFFFVTTCLFTASTIWLYFHLEKVLVAQISNELEFRHSIIDPLLSASRTHHDWEDIKNKLDVLSDKDSRTKYWVISKDSNYSYGTSPVSQQWLNLKEGFSIVPQVSENHYWMIFTRNFAANGERPAIRFITASDCTPFFDTLNKFSGIMMSTAITGILLLSCLGYLIARISLKPLRKLSAQANALSPGKSQERLDNTALPCELKELANSFNGVLARQEAAWKQLEGFNANVAHELRTPLTNMMGHTQVMLSHPRSANELEDLLASNLEEIERMTGIVNDMLFLSYAESGQRACELSNVVIREQLSKIVDYIEPVLAEHNLQINVIGHVVARIDKQLYKRACANLILNSIRYAKSGSTIEVHIEETEGRFIKTSITNVGDPITDEIRTRLFERFYRADAARTGSSNHHGLGLSIVRAIALMHGGDTFVHSENGKNTFGFTLLLQPEATENNPHEMTLV